MNKLFFLNRANNFCEALLLGNGRLGATVYGGVNEDVYNLNDDTLWSGYPRDYTFDGAEIFERVREQALIGELQEAQVLLEKLYGTYGQCYQPAGTIKIKADYGEYSQYKRTLYLDNAIHTTEFVTEKGKHIREAFVSNPDDLICIRYSCDKHLPPLEISFDCELKHRIYSENDALWLEGEAAGNAVPSYLAADERFAYSEDPRERGMRYAAVIKIKTDGKKCFSDSNIRIADASFLEIYSTVRTSFAGYKKHPYLEGSEYKKNTLGIVDSALKKEYNELKNRHVGDFNSLFGRVEFELEGGRPDLPTDERLRLHGDKADVGLYSLMYQFGRYLMISSSRKGTQPTNLQGIWNADINPPWSSNYTTNINTEMNYWGACGANLAECCEPLHRMIYELAESGRSTAKHLFSAEGFCVNHNVDIWRITHPTGNWRQGSSHYGFFPLAGAWLCRNLYEYYLDTKDLEFLGGKAFDAIYESCRFCDSMLTEDEGQLIFCPAASPENRFLYNGEKIAIAKSSAMFQSIVRDNFEICIDVCRILGRNTEYADYLEKRLERIPWLQVSEVGRILEWDGEREEYEPTHRHLSHLYSFYPAKKVEDEKLLDACKCTLEARGDVSTGWSSVWKMCLWAILGDGDRALVLADMLLSYLDSDVKRGKGGTYPNLLCAGPPAQIDGNFGYVAAVNEMLIQEKGGEVVFLPALPNLWRNGKVRGIRINGKTVDMEWRDGNIVSARVE